MSRLSEKEIIKELESLSPSERAIERHFIFIQKRKRNISFFAK